MDAFAIYTGSISVGSGHLFRNSLTHSSILPILGVINAYAAMLANQAGASAIYLSGAGVANACYGLPDLAMTSMDEVADEARRITDACDLPLLVDIDTGFGSLLNVARTIKCMEKAGVAAVHIEDQAFEKRCGHRDGKQLVSALEMGQRIATAVDARTDSDFVIMARTDALATESRQQVLERIQWYIEMGADMIFLEAIQDSSDLSFIAQQIEVPILVNSTEFGKTAIQTQQYWQQQGANMVLYPLTAFRAMSKVALDVYLTILKTGTQESLIPQLQTRRELYEVLNYEHFENKLSAIKGDEDA
jgi:methylisocitrate lyase